MPGYNNCLPGFERSRWYVSINKWIIYPFTFPMPGNLLILLGVIGLLINFKDADSFRPSRVNTQQHAIRNTLYASKQPPLPQDVVVCTTLGGTLSGFISGGLISGIFVNGDAAYSSPIGACLVGGLTLYALQTNDPEINEVLIPLFGQPFLDVKNDVTRSVVTKYETTRDAIIYLPQTIQSAINQKIEDVQAATNQKIEDTKAEVRELYL